MIRINLLPHSKKAAPGASAGGSSQGWIIAYFGAAAMLGMLLAGVWFVSSSELDEKARRNTDLTNQISQAQSLSAKLTEVQAKLKKSQDLEHVVSDLQKARLGPTRVLMEVSRILSANGGPTIDPQRLEQIRRDNPLAGFNPGWDPRRLWLTEFKEENRVVTILGVGKSNDDVGEFLRRLSLSDMFEDVALQKTEAVVDTDTSLPLIKFEFTAKVKY